MNRPHVAALLRKVADDVAKDGLAATAGSADAAKEVAPLIIEITQRLRVRAGEIEAGP